MSCEKMCLGMYIMQKISTSLGIRADGKVHSILCSLKETEFRYVLQGIQFCLHLVFFPVHKPLLKRICSKRKIYIHPFLRKGTLANSIDSDQSLQNAAYDQDLNCLS